MICRRPPDANMADSTKEMDATKPERGSRWPRSPGSAAGNDSASYSYDESGEPEEEPQKKGGWSSCSAVDGAAAGPAPGLCKRGDSSNFDTATASTTPAAHG